MASLYEQLVFSGGGIRCVWHGGYPSASKVTRTWDHCARDGKAWLAKRARAD